MFVLNMNSFKQNVTGPTLSHNLLPGVLSLMTLGAWRKERESEAGQDGRMQVTNG